MGENFVSKHALRHRPLDPNLSLQTFEGEPVSNSLVTHSVLTHLSITNHSEFKSFSIAQMPHSVILSLDWLKAHNPVVDWVWQSLHFSCCGSGTKNVGDAQPSNSHANLNSPASGLATSDAFPSLSLVSANELVDIPDVMAMGILCYLPSVPPVPTSIGSTNADSDPDLQHILMQLPPEYHDFADHFCKQDAEILTPHRPGHNIHVDIEEGKSPPFGPIYSLSQKEHEALHKYIVEHLNKGFICPSSSPAASPILFVKKANRELHLCIDYHGLNAITKCNHYPLPLVNDLLNLICGSTIFTKLDLKTAFNLLRIAPGDKWKTAFRTNEGLFEYLVMPFGLTNAPSAFLSFMQWVLHEMLDINCVIYLDDILVFSCTHEEHTAHVMKVLEKLQEYGLYCGIDKCKFMKEELEYLSFLIGSNSVRMHPKKLETIANWPEPKSLRAIQQWLGFTNFYHRFIAHYAKIAAPLYNLTKKSVPTPFSLTPDAHATFETLHNSFISAPFLIHFDDAKEAFLFTDASDFAISGILHQKGDDGELHPVAFFSQKLEPTEINYDVHDKEMLAVIASLQEFCQWLSSTLTPVSIITDHNNLHYFMSQRQLNQCQSCWAMELSEFNILLSYALGNSNPADAPSQREDYVPTEGDPTKLENHHCLLSEKVCLGLMDVAVPAIQVYVNSIVSLAVDASIDVQRLSDELEKDDIWKTSLDRKGSLFKHVNGVVTFDDRVYILPSLCLSILNSRQNSALAGHFRCAKTLELIHQEFSWPGISKDVAKYVRGCDSCQCVKSSTHTPYGLLDPISIPDTPWSSISMDFITGLLPSHAFDSIFVVVDHPTKQSHFIPTTTNIDATGLVSLYLSNVVRLHSVLDTTISDCSSIFASSFWWEIQSRLGTKTKYSTAFHPCTDGQMERVNAIFSAIFVATNRMTGLIIWVLQNLHTTMQHQMQQKSCCSSQTSVFTPVWICNSLEQSMSLPQIIWRIVCMSYAKN